jgi:hypothetical protein
MRPTLIVNPVTDRAFVEFANQELDGARDIEGLKGRLRTRYPHAAVHVRLLSGEGTTVWYVYRDGHWTDPRGSQDHAAQLKELEAQKSALDPADPRVVDLSRRIDALVATLSDKAHAELELSEEIQGT